MGLRVMTRARCAVSSRVVLVLSALVYLLAAGFAPAVAYAEAPTALIVGVIAAQATDLLTTDMALHRTGTVELNPLMRARVNRYTFKVGAATVTAWGVTHLWTSGHREAAVLVAVTHMAAFGLISLRNYEIYRGAGVR